MLTPRPFDSEWPATKAKHPVPPVLLLVEPEPLVEAAVPPELPVVEALPELPVVDAAELEAATLDAPVEPAVTDEPPLVVVLAAPELLELTDVVPLELLVTPPELEAALPDDVAELVPFEVEVAALVEPADELTLDCVDAPTLVPEEVTDGSTHWPLTQMRSCLQSVSF